ncbi:histone H1-like [Olea europaea subsp. europaea]|uniref:Histone H1-like n=1 Tax=Olea europaea subsp. europaea TaxID=158383 RepID=A0A8S0R4I3_OLEEU|nr:histone H1-like [Olea europaea subsp. europaea]
MAISKKNTKRKTSSSSSSPSNLHPPYLQMISEAITTMKDPAGSSQPAIAKFIEAKYSASLPTNFKKILSAQLKGFVKSGKLVKVKNLYKISPSEKVKKAANSVENKTQIKKSVKNVTAKTPVFQIQSGSFASSQSESPISASLELSSFSLNTNEENVGGASTERSIGVKKAKVKRKNDEESQKFIETFNDENQQLLEILKNGCKVRQQFFEIKMLRTQNELKKLSLIEYREENKILLKDLNSISNPIVRDFLQNEQIRILRKRSQQ